MAQGRWRTSEDQLATEAYAVFIWDKPPTRSYPKGALKNLLAKPEIYPHFLKLCLEFDDSADLKTFRKGLLLVTKAMGATNLANAAGLTRVTLYRMLSKGGNPRLKSLIALMKGLKMRIWAVDEDFIRSRTKLVRPKDIAFTWDATNKTHSHVR